MPLRSISLGADQPSTAAGPPYQDGNNIASNIAPIPMGNGVSILVFAARYLAGSPNTTVARAFTVNADGTQNWGNSLELTTVFTGGFGAALDTTHALVITTPGGAAMRAQVLTLSGLTLSAGPPTTFNNPPAFDGFAIGPQSVVRMNANTVLFGYRATTGIDRAAVRVHRIDISGTAVTVDFANAVSLFDTGPGSSSSAVDEVRLIRLDDLTVAAFWVSGVDGTTNYGLAQLAGAGVFDLSLGFKQLYDGVVYYFQQFLAVNEDDGFVVALGTKIQPGPDQAVAVMLEWSARTYALTKGPIVELTLTMPTSFASGFFEATMAGRLVVAVAGSTGSDQRVVVLNLGTAAFEIQEVGFADFTPAPGVAPFGISTLSATALNPRRVLHIYKVNGGASLARMFTSVVPLVDPLRWRQRDDCLTPGSATPCICFNLPYGQVCVPPWSLRITTSVQFGGRVGAKNTYY